MDKNLIKNLNGKKMSIALVAHVDHGKTTLARAIIGKLNENLKVNELLDGMSVEQQRGITVKTKLLTLQQKSSEGEGLILNLVDTPGHVDFASETQRALLVTDVVVLLVDSTKGLQAQSLANYRLAKKLNKRVIFVVTKIDVNTSDAKKTTEQIKKLSDMSVNSIVEVSAKSGIGIENLLNTIRTVYETPKEQVVKNFQAFIFDAFYDDYLGVVFLVKIISGSISLHDSFKINNSKETFKSDNMGFITIDGFEKKQQLVENDLGYICCNLKQIKFSYLGGTIVKTTDELEKAVISYKPAMPILYSTLYPIERDDYEKLKKAIEKLVLNDCSVSVEQDSSKTMGFGFKCGFMGSLHLEVFIQRLSSEHYVDCITSVPSVAYVLTLKNGATKVVKNASDWPERSLIESAKEQYVNVTIISNASYLGNIMELLSNQRGNFDNLEYIDSQNVNITAQLPLSELISGFAESLKSVSSGYASLSYELAEMRETQLEKLDILIGGEIVESLSTLVYAPLAAQKGRKIVATLKENIPRQLFEVAVQAAIGKKVVARETVKALRKDVLAKCYGGDITRKKKLLEKQKRGKEKMQQIGKVNVPRDAFIAVLKVR